MELKRLIPSGMESNEAAHDSLQSFPWLAMRYRKTEMDHAKEGMEFSVQGSNDTISISERKL